MVEHLRFNELGCLIFSILVFQAIIGLCSNSHKIRQHVIVKYLHPGQRIRLEEHDSGKLLIYCYTGRPKHIINIWQTALLQLDIVNDNYELYDGANENEVLAEYEQHRSSWTINPFSWKQKDIKLNPFNQSCVGILSSEDYVIHLNIIRIDYWRILLLGAGMLLFISAPKLSNNPLFYYICGISVGICASFLILVYIMSKLLPKRPIMYGFLIGGWTVGIYFLQYLWQNLRLMIEQYRSHVLSYVVFTGIASFVICYRLGPVTDQRSKDLIKWALQGTSLSMIFFSSQFQEASVAIIIIILLAYNFPAVWTSKLLAYWKRHFPPQTKLLNEAEYYEQGARETAKELEKLREYCSSPDCNPWKTVLKLKEPLRFASFIGGTSHLSDEELLAYESETRRSFNEYYTDDSESSSES